MKNDITSREDILKVLHTFYSTVLQAPELNDFFQKTHWEHHLPVMADFWSNALFYTGSYVGNPMEIHTNIHKRKPLKSQDFDMWLDYLVKAVNEHFKGPNAENMKIRAKNIVQIMKTKMVT